MCLFLTLLGLQSRFGDNLGQATWKLAGVSPKRDWSSKRVKDRVVFIQTNKTFPLCAGGLTRPRQELLEPFWINDSH